MGSVANSQLSFGADWCLRFVERRCGSFVWAPLSDEGKRDEAGDATGSSVLSLAEVDLGVDAQEAAEHEHLAVLALRIRGEPGARTDRLVLRFVTPSVTRSASRAYGARWLINDITVPTPAGLVSISLLVYRIRRTLRLRRVLLAVENMVDMLEAAEDDDRMVLGRAVLELLEVLDDTKEAEVVLSGFQMRFEDAGIPNKERFLAVVDARPATPPIGKLWLTDRKLCEGEKRDSATPINNRAYVLLRFGTPSTRQSVRDFIDEIRRRHQGRPSESTANEGESFTSFVDRELEKRRQKRRRDFIHRLGLGEESLSERIPVVTPIVMEISDDLVPLIKGPTAETSLSDAASRCVEAMRKRVVEQLGIEIPPVRFRGNPNLAHSTYSILIYEAYVVSGQCRIDRRFSPMRASELEAIGLHVEVAHHPKLGDGSWVAPEQWSRVEEHLWETLEYPIRHLEKLVIENLEDFLGFEETCTLLSESRCRSADIINNDRGLVAKLANVLRRLIREQVPILAFERICDKFIELEQGHTPMLECVEHVRMLDEVRPRLPGNETGRVFFRVGPRISDQVESSIKTENNSRFLTLEPDIAKEFISIIRMAVKDKRCPCTLIVPEKSIRVFVWRLIHYEIQGLPVLSAEEVLSEPLGIEQLDIVS